MVTDGIDQIPPGEFAPAKVNLCLHVTGRQADGYHLLDSLVVFAGVGDRVSAAPASGLSLTVTGPEARGLAAEEDNLVLRAARLLGVRDAALTLEKHLPIASGIGGGSADAAATLRLLSRMAGRTLPDTTALLGLGADVPVCVAGDPLRMKGVGEHLSPLPPLPPFWLVLANPRLPVPTPKVFAALASRQNAPVPDLPGAALESAPAFAAWLAANTRNDLVPPAHQIAPVLAQVQKVLEQAPGCLLARMSGSGGTHFGLFASESSAATAANHLRSTCPGWWVAMGARL